MNDDRSTATATATLHALADRAEITDLVSRLGRALDEGRFDEMRTLLVDEVTVRTPGGTAEGTDAVVAQAARNHTSDERVQHVVTNVLVDLDGDRATARANLLVHFAALPTPDAPAPAPHVRFTLGEVYRFEFARTEHGWRFAHIETTPVWLSGTFDRAPRAS